MPDVEGVPDQLIADADWNGEMALRAYVDGFYEEALAPADRAVKYTRRILRRRPDDQKVIEFLADRHRLRAVIHQVLGDHRACRSLSVSVAALVVMIQQRWSGNRAVAPVLLVDRISGGGATAAEW